MLKKWSIRCLISIFVIAIAYGIGRLYFHYTAGFTIANITSDFPFNPEWEVRSLSSSETVEMTKALNQNYHYLGKGCQSYVFVSDDQQYVIKFFKYQRYRLQLWLAYFPSLPSIVKYREEKMIKKWQKLDGFVKSWKVAFEHLKDETGLVFVHLNKTNNLHTQLTIYDKLGLVHRVDLDQMEFCIQQKADLLCDTILSNQQQNDRFSNKKLVDDLLSMIQSEYKRGLADQDHALMQNTGVAQGHPVHIDVGQFVFTDAVKTPAFAHQELFTKTYKFHRWLQENDPELSDYLDHRLAETIGPSYASMKPKFREKH